MPASLLHFSLLLAAALPSIAAGTNIRGSGSSARLFSIRSSMDSAEHPTKRLNVLVEPNAAVVPKFFPKLEVGRSYGLENEYQLNLGKTIDTLRHDYPNILSQKPDFSIFTKNVELFDNSGKLLGGLGKYERVFKMLRFLRSTTMSAAEVTYRLVVQDSTIRVRWCAKLWMRDPLAGLSGLGKDAGMLHQLDGISVYELDSDGLVRLHRLEHIALAGPNQEAVINLGFAWPRAELATPVAARPFFSALTAAIAGADLSGSLASRAVVVGVSSHSGQSMQQLQKPEKSHQPPSSMPPSLPPPPPSSLPQQLLQSRPEAQRTAPPQASASGETPMERAERERAEEAAKARRLMQQRESKRKKGWGINLASLAPTPCETSFDCESPMVCCDLVFTSICCSSGLMVGMPPSQLQGALIPIPVEVDNDGWTNLRAAHADRKVGK